MPPIKREVKIEIKTEVVSHFDQFDNFQPNDTASFEDEFSRLASSQEWQPGSQEYVRQRTRAINNQLTLHYFWQPQPKREPLGTVKEEEDHKDGGTEYDDDTGYDDHLPEDRGSPASDREGSPDVVILSKEEVELLGFQRLCKEVGIDPPSDRIGVCKRQLKGTLVNIVDLIDARRTGKKVRVWDDFGAFRAYTLLPEHRIDREVAKEGIMKYLLQDLRSPSRRSYRGHGDRVVSGRVIKAESSGRAWRAFGMYSDCYT
ncbi:hypothetical protein QBC47DRAFT_395195 [Echria macrotheca]|uniref:Uncharacterized protein n=1 Tax=Echria macrotheca TaxID=438768 RepID=A0AAJ0B3U9_9PEZI|nr:hypothetical protein QBC47DRAFT_395195 [Echria macrotheca]